jgi:hypothetical protein
LQAADGASGYRAGGHRPASFRRDGGSSTEALASSEKAGYEDPAATVPPVAAMEMGV